MKALSKEEVQVLAPQAFAQAPAETVSSKYSFLPSSRIIDDMETLGWQVCGAKSMKSRGKNATRAQHGPHIIEFFNPGVTIKSGEETEAYVKVVMVNNSMGAGRIRFEVGVFRLICENGLMIKSSDFGGFKLRHLGYSFSDLSDMMNDILNQLPLAVTKINTFNNTVLSVDQKVEFATEAIKIRMGNGKEVTVEEIESVLQVSRPEDEGDTLWAILNRVQEAIIRGGSQYTNAKGKTRTMRPIKNMLQDMSINQDLWSLADQYTEEISYEVIS